MRKDSELTEVVFVGDAKIVAKLNEEGYTIIKNGEHQGMYIARVTDERQFTSQLKTITANRLVELSYDK